MMYGLHFCLVEKSGDQLVIGTDLPQDDLRTLAENRGVLLWDNDGQWGLMAHGTLRNCYALLHDYNRRGLFGRITQAPASVKQIDWSQMKIISPKIAKMIRAKLAPTPSTDVLRTV
jgi:hypothetical protein